VEAAMGFSISWLAVQGVDVAQAAEAMGFALGEPMDFVDGDSIAELAGGWVLVWSEDFEALHRGRFAPLLKFGPAVGCSVEEHVMFQEARGYREGVEVWRVTHDPNEGESLYDLTVIGDPPASLAAIRDAAVKEQDARGGEDAGVDFICDVPLDLARSICGFKHDLDAPAGSAFWQLRRVRAGRTSGDAKPGLFGRLFGGR
jgi:hypothetical protein